MKGQISKSGGSRRLLATVLALLGLFLALCASASAKTAQTITFTSTAPGNALAGESYDVSAASSSQLPVELSAGGACSFTAPPSVRYPVGNEKRPEERERFFVSPQTVYLTEAGTCMIAARVSANSEYEAAPEQHQQFVVTRNPSEQISFATTAPSNAMVGGEYRPGVQSSPSVELEFSFPTPSVCEEAGGTVAFRAPGTCTIAVRQQGVSQSEPPEAEQSFTVVKGAQRITFASSGPTRPAIASGSYEASATSSAHLPVKLYASGACTFSMPGADEEETLEPEVAQKQSPPAQTSPATAYLVAAGTCTISAQAAGNADYEEASEVSQSFPVAKGPPEQITFVSSPPSEALVGEKYHPTVQLSGGIRVSFGTTTPAVCAVTEGAISLVGTGTCTIGVREQGISEQEPPEAQQSFAVAKGSQQITFTSTPPSSPVAGGSYEASATSSAGLPVDLVAQGACSFTKPTPGEDETLGPVVDKGVVVVVPRQSPATVYFIAPGTCTISAEAPGNSGYERAQVSQSFPVAKDPSEQITFVSRAPSQASVGETYDPTVALSAGISVSFSTTTPSVCKIEEGAVALDAAGTCTIAVRQNGVSAAEPPEAQQSFTVLPPATVRAELLKDARSLAARHKEPRPYDIQAVLTTERRARQLEDAARPGHERVFGGDTAVYFIAMKGRFTFVCEKAPGTHPSCQRTPVLMAMVSVATKKVLVSTEWGEQYPNLNALGTPVRLGS